jgi:predicted nucleotidyltransferase
LNARTVPASFAPDTVADIDARLDAIARDQHVRVPLAIESGSRAWGFPSPDSDYDCRFIFVRREEDYLTLFPQPDVIEVPLEGDLDVNGWDLAKALRLMLKGNAVVLEWLRSPIAYRCHSRFRDAFLNLARDCADRRLVGRHYLHLGERQRRTYFGDGKDIALKKLFYALRPAAALRWMRLHEQEAVPPMHFPTLLAECEPSRDVAEIVAELLARKAETRELGTGPLPQTIALFVAEEFAQAREAFETEPVSPSPDARAKASAFFREVVRRPA